MNPDISRYHNVKYKASLNQEIRTMTTAHCPQDIWSDATIYHIGTDILHGVRGPTMRMLKEKYYDEKQKVITTLSQHEPRIETMQFVCYFGDTTGSTWSAEFEILSKPDPRSVITSINITTLSGTQIRSFS